MRTIICLFWLVILTSCSKGIEVNTAIVFPASSWASSSPEAQGVNRDSLSKALGYLSGLSNKNGVDRTLVIKNGYVIFSGDSLNIRHNIYSCTKTLTSTVMGLLIADGKTTVSAKASSYEPLLKDLYPEVTLKHFATMTSGYAAVGKSRWNEPSEDWGWTPYQPDTPYFKPGAAYAYWDEAQMMFGRVLAKVADEDLYTILDRRIMEPIGIEDWEWGTEDTITTSTGDPLPLRNGCTGIQLTASEFARLGWLFANKGVWNGDTLIPPAFLNAAMRNQVPEDLDNTQTDRSSVKGAGVYGYNWWTSSPNSKAEFRMPNSPSDAVYMSGFNHNVCLVVPSENLVVVRMGEDGNPAIEKSVVYDVFLRYML